MVGATGAATGELVGMMATQLYHKDASQLTEGEKETVSTLATLAAGLAGGLTGDSTTEVLAGAQTGKTVVENNSLAPGAADIGFWLGKSPDCDVTCKANIAKGVAEGDLVVSAGLAGGSGIVLLPGSAQAMWFLGAGSNAGVSYLFDGSIDPTNAAIAGWVNVLSMGNGLAGTIGWNAAGGALGNWIADKDPLSGALINGSGSAAGYGIGKGLSWGVNAGANWWKGGWDPKFNPMLQKYSEIKGDFGISKEMTPSPVPSSFDDLGGSIFSEVTGKGVEAITKQNGTGEKK
ncbi:VENN motif pre-toxin domain-containing protein [Aeromonas jandaei]|uniref:VENN motif pre-toxin domain-containing protein n=1 Tax=Aeromonas jandaei TaxID=650 RepID=UPI00227CC1FC|nr:VENN motif pre-toxin domain-containing protein [Aeromonas jandaei]WAG08731.1 VENN motif pre-toxin domain-containing protein [Aeromonas jandaei]